MDMLTVGVITEKEERSVGHRIPTNQRATGGHHERKTSKRFAIFTCGFSCAYSDGTIAEAARNGAVEGSKK
jgi:hypothetical protein